MRCFDLEELKEYENPGTVEFFRELGKKAAAESIKSIGEEIDAYYERKRQEEALKKDMEE